jgi:hypothetical protein
MSMEKLFGNKVMQKMIFGKLSDFCRENGIRSIVLNFDEHGKMSEPVFYTDETVTLSKQEFADAIKQS